MNVLALECSGPTVTAALQIADHYREIHLNCGSHHANSLMPAIDTLLSMCGLNPQNLDLVACSLGPGTFTGLRVGLATAKGIAVGTGCSLKAVPSLPILAAGRHHWPGIVVPVMDARKGRVYVSAYKNGFPIRDEADTYLESFLESLSAESGNLPVLVTGPGAPLAQGYGVILDTSYDASRGRHLVEMAVDFYHRHGPDGLDNGPRYLRSFDAC